MNPAKSANYPFSHIVSNCLTSFPRKRESTCSDARAKMDSRFRGNDGIIAFTHVDENVGGVTKAPSRFRGNDGIAARASPPSPPRERELDEVALMRRVRVHPTPCATLS